MTPLYEYNTLYQPAKNDTENSVDPFGAWTVQKGYQSATKLRMPAILASSRLKLSSRRCDELQGSIDDLKDRLLNVPALMPFEHRSELERRLLQVETALHTERTTAWRDLLPLTREMRDAAIEDLRTSFLNEFTRLVGDQERGNP